MESSKISKFPNSLEGFGYGFNQDGKLEHLKTMEPFQFVVREGDHSYNQEHYEALGEVINEEIYSLLETKCDLKKLPVPKDCHGDEPSTFIFASDDYKTAKRLIVLIHGSGVVRAGQWSRRLIVNNSLEIGTQIPFIEEAKSSGFGLVVLNTNDNARNGLLIRGSENPCNHASDVWTKYIDECSASEIFIIAHSFGGVVTVNLFQNINTFQERVVAVALTDSVHQLGKTSNLERLLQISRNWVTSNEKLDTPVKRSNDIECVSAGCTQHEWTSYCSITSIFKYFEARKSKDV